MYFFGSRCKSYNFYSHTVDWCLCNFLYSFAWSLQDSGEWIDADDDVTFSGDGGSGSGLTSSDVDCRRRDTLECTHSVQIINHHRSVCCQSYFYPERQAEFGYVSLRQAEAGISAFCRLTLAHVFNIQKKSSRHHRYHLTSFRLCQCTRSFNSQSRKSFHRPGQTRGHFKCNKYLRYDRDGATHASLSGQIDKKFRFRRF